MDDSYQLTLSGLLRKRAELSGSAEGLRAQLMTQLSALDHIDAVIRVFRPDIDLADLPDSPVPVALSGTRGEFQRFLLDALRKAEGPLTTHDLARLVMAERGMNAADRVTFKLISERVGNSLGKLRKAGRVVSSKVGKSAMLEWRAPDSTPATHGTIP